MAYKPDPRYPDDMVDVVAQSMVHVGNGLRKGYRHEILLARSICVNQRLFQPIIVVLVVVALHPMANLGFLVGIVATILILENQLMRV